MCLMVCVIELPTAARESRELPRLRTGPAPLGLRCRADLGLSPGPGASGPQTRFIWKPAMDHSARVTCKTSDCVTTAGARP